MTPEEIADSLRRSVEIESGKPLVVFKDPAVSGHGSVRVATPDTAMHVLRYPPSVRALVPQRMLNANLAMNCAFAMFGGEPWGETQLVNVDLVETFNWHLGLTVRHIEVIRGVRVVKGTNPDGDRTLVLWRNLDETNNNALDEWFRKQGCNTKAQEYDLICVNGDNNLENLRRGDQTWKVRLFEEQFGRLMFDVEDI
jgi:hypothetical protein